MKGPDRGLPGGDGTIEPGATGEICRMCRDPRKILYSAGQPVDNAAPGLQTFYREGPLLWLQVDSISARKKARGARQPGYLFAAGFFGPSEGVVTVKPYTYQDPGRWIEPHRPPTTGTGLPPG